VVAHHVSLIAVQAESAPYRLPDLPAAARDEFAGISSAARESLHEMRRLLGVLRSEQPAERAPQPDLGDLRDLIETARHAGMTVELRTGTATGDRAGRQDGLGEVPATVGTSAYRIIQESLTNAGRHAPGAPVRIGLDRGPDALRIEVVNGPRQAAGPDPAATGQPGHGLVGMRERAAMLGGSLDAGAAPGGGFRVVAVLPLTGGGPGAGTAEPVDRAGHTDRTDHGGDG
jgi:signal transduction histidine kinase